MQVIINFLSELKHNNNREWFTDNKAVFLEASKTFENFVEMMLLKIKSFDTEIDIVSAKETIFRIYRDSRFSKNKEPYKPNFGAYISKGGKKSPFAGYYLHIEPGESFAGGGIYCPMPPVLKTVREHIAYDSSELVSILNSPMFHKNFPELYGETVKTVPRGFDKTLPNSDLLKYKSYTVIQKFNDSDLLHPDFSNRLVELFRIQKPFNDYLNKAIQNNKE